MAATAPGLPPPALKADNGGFAIEGIFPRPYRLGVVPGIRTPLGGWWLKSVIAAGVDLLDAPLDLRRSEDNAVVTFADRASELSGRVTGSDGRPARDHWVIAFGTNNQSWYFNSRRVAGVPTDADGRYSIRNLPPGEYFVAVTDDAEPGEWFDAALLARLMDGAGRVSMVATDRTPYDVVVRP
jgi:hypothetical protein